MFNVNPKGRWKNPTGYPVAYSAPRPKFSNGRMIALAAGILLVSNFLTFILSSSKTEKKEMVQAIKTESLYLIDKASQYISNVSVFESKVRQVSNNLNIPPEWLMAVMYTESRFNPSVQNF